MTPITRIEIVNFQSHAHTVIKPAEGGQLTVVTGATDSGKSGVFRALRWVYYGGPCYPRIGCTHTAVHISHADGTVVTRERQGRTNRYVIERPGEESQVFEGFGRDIPLEVQEALGVRPVVVAGDTLEVNLARQHDPAFLGSGISAPARARILGHVAGIEAVDKAVMMAAADIVTGQREANRLAREIAELEEEVARYDYLPALAERIERLEELRDAAHVAAERKAKLEAVWEQLARLRNERHQWEVVWTRTSLAEDAAAKIEQAQAAASRLRAIQAIRDQIASLDEQQQEASRRLGATRGAARAAGILARVAEAARRRERLEGLKRRLFILDGSVRLWEKRAKVMGAAMTAAEPIRTLEEHLGRLKRLTWMRSSLADLRQQEQQARGSLELAAAEAERARKLYISTLQDAGRCPVCGSPAHEEHIREVV